MNSFLPLMLVLFVAGLNCNAHAMGEITEQMLAEAQDVIDKACPVRWQRVRDKIIVPADLSEDIWQDASDKTEFINYVTNQIAESGITADANVLADDVASVVAECSTARTAYLDLLLIKEPNDVLTGLGAIKSQLEQQSVQFNDGSTAELAAKDCKAIKQGFADSTNGVYWVDFDGAGERDAEQVFCEMEVDGGGWTLVAYRGKGHFFGNEEYSFYDTAYGEYDLERKASPYGFSLGVLPMLDETELMVSGVSPDPAESHSQKYFVRYRYAESSPMFSHGPTIPCTSASVEESYGLENPNFHEAKIRYCNNSNRVYYGASSGGGYYSLMFVTTNGGAHFAGPVRTQNPNHTSSHAPEQHAWFYAR